MTPNLSSKDQNWHHLEIAFTTLRCERRLAMADISVSRALRQKTAYQQKLSRLGLLAFLFFYYGFLLTAGHFDLWRPGEGLELTFNSMLEHLLRGEFNVDPSSVGNEGFYRDGRTFAYWGILFAVLRLPLLLFPGGLEVNVTPFSCLVAVVVGAYVKLLTLNQVFLNTESSATRTVLFWALAFSIVFSGPQIEFLTTSLYQEVCLWAGSLGAIFVYCAVRGIVQGRFGTSALCCMAIMAGLALLARVSVAVGLYAALGLLLVTIIVREAPNADGEAKARTAIGPFLFEALSGRCLLPTLILLSFAFVAGLVNFYRWGDPLVFVNYDLYIMNEFYPDRLRRTEAYGLFNLNRVPFGLVYYFFPIWVLHRPDGQLLFEEHQTRLIDATELPPSSFLLTDPLLIILLAVLCGALVRGRLPDGINKHHTLALLAGLTVPCLLMLSAISMNFRYRIDFYTLLEFGAFVGYFVLCKANLGQRSVARLRSLWVASTVVGIGASHLVLFLYKLSPAGPPISHLRPGLILFYAGKVASHFPSLTWILQ